MKFLTTLLLVLSLGASCTDLNKSGEEPNDKLLSIKIQTTSDAIGTSIAIPGTIDANKIETMDILIFNADNILCADMESFTSGSLNSFKIELNKGIYNVLFLANCHEQVSALYAGLVMNQSSKSDVIKQLCVTNTAQWNNSIPMWNETDNLDPSVNSSIEIKMLRMLTKIDVTIDQNDNTKRFKLTSVYLYNALNKGQVIPNAEAFDPDITDHVSRTSLPKDYNILSDNPLEYTANDDHSCTDRIYTFETGPTQTDPDEAMNQATCLLLEGTYDGTKAYYRIDFYNIDPASKKRVFVPLLRNYKHLISVNSVSGPGYSDPLSALHSRSTGISYTVTEWNDKDINVVIPGINKQILGFSNTSYILDAQLHNGYDPNKYDNNELIIYSTEGWTVDKNQIVDDKGKPATWLSLNQNKYKGDPGKSTVYIYIYIYIATSWGEWLARTAYIPFCSGSIVYKLKVTQLTNYEGDIVFEEQEANEQTFKSIPNNSILEFDAENPQKIHLRVSILGYNRAIIQTKAAGDKAFQFKGSPDADDLSTIQSMGSKQQTFTIQPIPITADEQMKSPMIEKLSKTTFNLPNRTSAGIWIKRSLYFKQTLRGVRSDDIKLSVAAGSSGSFTLFYNTKWQVGVESSNALVLDSPNTGGDDYPENNHTVISFHTNAITSDAEYPELVFKSADGSVIYHKYRFNIFKH